MTRIPGTARILITALITTLGGNLADAALRGNVEPVPVPHVGCGKAHALQQRYLLEHAHTQWQAEYDTLLAAGAREALTDTDLLHCDLEIEILPDQYDNLIGSNIMTIQSKVDNLTQFSFRLRNQFSIANVVINGSTSVGFTTPSATTRVVTLDRPYNDGEVFTLTIEYSGHAESRGFGSIEFTSHNTADIVYTLSEAYYAYTWWPAKDGDFGDPGDMSDKFTLDIAVISPDDMVTASNGLLQGVDPLTGNRHRYRWSSNYPIATYLVCFSSTNYNAWTETYVPLAGGTMPVVFYIYPEHDTPTNRNAWNKAVDMLYTLRNVFGEYPFVDEKYGIYECEFGGGMEHQTFTAQGTFLERITAHELGHQWWGDEITCRTWNHIWLNEGFATYTEALWEELKPGSPGLSALKAAMTSKRYTGGGTVHVSDAEVSSLYDIFDGNTSYNKGAWVLHMLRHVLGDAAFFDTLAAYRAAYAGSAATTEDFQAVCEQFYPGGDLHWFFSEWIYGEYVPSYEWGWDAVTVNGQGYVLLYVDQIQSGSYQRFTMPIDIVVDGTVHSVFNDADPEHFVLPISAPPTTVQFDPDNWILTGTRLTGSYVPGPPIIIQTWPAPGTILTQADATDAVEVTFHTDVSTIAGDYALSGAQTGPVAVSFTYSGLDNAATLSTGSPLPADTYSLTVSDTLTATNSGQALDGEMTGTALPSGDGTAGGAAQIEFTIICAFGDADCDHDIDLADFARFQQCFTGPDAGPATPNCTMMRFDPDADIDQDDLTLFDQALTGP